MSLSVGFLPYPRVSPRCKHSVSAGQRYQQHTGIFPQFDSVASECQDDVTTGVETCTVNGTRLQGKYTKGLPPLGSVAPTLGLTQHTDSTAFSSLTRRAFPHASPNIMNNDRKSRHRRIKKQRRYERLAATSQFLGTARSRTSLPELIVFGGVGSLYYDTLSGGSRLYLTGLLPHTLAAVETRSP